MPTPLRMTPKQARKYAFTGEQKPQAKPQNAMASHEDARRSEKPAEPVSCAIGEKWQVAKGLQNHFDNPPQVGSRLKIWCILKNCIFLVNEEYSLSVSSRVLREYFVREEAETHEL